MKESSEVLARKYRPINFDELIGQETISQTLSLALDSNRLSHAYLFSGLRGSGKTSTARILAKALICEQGLSHKPCGTCQNCISALGNRHIDIIEMDGASSRKIDDIRDLIEQTKYKPASSRFKIFIIDEVHMLTKEAFNALLKTLEEPPSYVKFILATTDPLKLPATILSRTQHFRFKSIATNKIINHLAHILNIEGIQYETDALEILARSGSGSLRDTLTLLDQAIIYSKNHVDVRTVTDMLGLVDPKFIGELFGAVFAKDYARLVELTKVLEDYEAEMVVDELIAYLKDRMYSSDALFSTLVLDRFFRILSESKYLFSINADGSFVLSLIFFKMIEALRIKEVDQMIESLQKEISRPAIAVSVPEPTQEVETPYMAAAQTFEDEIQTPNIETEIAPAVQDRVLHVEVDPNLKVFQELIAKIKDRSFELGECFEKSISFISYRDSILTWESCANEECKKALTHGYSAIKQLVREIFGFETKIKHEACRKTTQELYAEPEKETQTIEQPTMQHTQSTSMVEDAEIGGSASCVTSCESSDSSKEIDAVQMKDEPMVQKAVELFEAKKMTIQSKI
ncbi:DNA polymerase III subunit gamma/tau [Candidatus Sulfurimonas marisnigri]|uniref:DNA polymerase III subunit gamma/tau n=1 Tax=Candidatus Sulfurimonas marisnigri TaxID=2740405 RepID=A0A7S7M0U3_9BACT|nr:DNA polymerase III subunit gamma/tau [Candidatus Sulfurimonas marisnigri]QOY54169.1 DNA polymerase III subunit gamma/tau [Candidatus Sulfurimonas marisnigri]